MDVNKVMILMVVFICVFVVMASGCSPECDSNSTMPADSSSGDVRLSRKRRYLVFPEGASVSVACCLTVGMYGNPSYTWISWAVNWGLAYDLPNETYSQMLRRKLENEMPESVTKRRFRRDLYHKMEVAMDDMGYNGRECILRALCETSQLFGKKGTTMVKELLRTVFSLPSTKVLPFEHPDLKIYDTAHRAGKRRDAFCADLYPDCGFSLHGIALGHYSEPPPEFMM